MASPVTLQQVIQSFTDCKNVYLRDREIKEIRKFLSGEEPILHITGSPGTGKTATVRSALSEEEFEYANYFSEPCIKKLLEGTKKRTVVIDEFDKYYTEKKKECLKLLINLRKQEKRTITISNNLRMGNLRFGPYTADQLKRIIRLKMEKEIGSLIMGEACIEFLAKRHEKTGDVRGLFQAVLQAILQAISKKGSKDSKISNDLSNSPLAIMKSAENETIFLEIKDFIVTEKAMEQSIHHKIINKIKESELSRIKAYKEYLTECTELSIPCITRTDFDIIFEMI